MYAIIRSGGKQYRVSEGDRIAVERLDTPEGDTVTLDDVLLVDRDGQVSIGAPVVVGASVTAEVESHFKAPEVYVFKYKNKTRRRVLRGHRQQQTRLRVTGIRTA